MKDARLVRVAELLRTEAGREVARQLAGTGAPLVSVTRTWVSPDLSCADLFVLPVDPSLPPGRALTAVRRVLPQVQRALAERLELRRTPRLRVKVDDGQLAEDHIGALLDRIARERPSVEH